MRPLIDTVLTTGMLAVVPAGLRLLRVPHRLLRAWWLGAVPGALSLWLERGPWAAGAASAYALATVCLAVQAPIRLRTRPSPSPREIAALTALVTPAIAAVALVAERAGYPLWGFSLTILSLTVAHFHFAGFAAALVAGLTSRAAGDGPLSRAAALSVPGGTLLVLGGYFAGDWAELAGAVVLTAGMWLVGWLTLAEVRRGGHDRITGALLTFSSLVLAVSMVLALSWALGEATGLPRPPLDWMIATHGLLNAFGFAVCAIAAWLRLRPRPL
ncbi:YndJ family protein [Planomonospora sp. ID67723]|uniref:YndJ family protein n=1 Tax=Planomonospora sp. ID67723 TaxID=2738134 RepID=UPI0018C36486|nr:YndJ family protein [Planomonospora sp. ID67723]MBG0830430.1 YndJ family protein [Planomonospora sp. ID67723]